MSVQSFLESCRDVCAEFPGELHGCLWRVSLRVAWMFLESFLESCMDVFGEFP